MTSARQNEQPIDDLLSKLLDARLDENEREQLLDFLQRDPHAREKYHEHIALHAMLHWIDSEPLEHAANEPAVVGVTLPDALPVSQTPILGFLGNVVHGTASYAFEGWPLAYLLATVIVVTGLVIGGLIPVPQVTQVARQSPFSAEFWRNGNAHGVGRVTGTLDCHWAPGEPVARDGDYVSVGRPLKLDAGLLEITYDTGAKIILQGPATYAVASANSGFLSSGKLVGEMATEKAKGFTVRTPTATVVDLGTEFGVEVDREGGTRSHVFAGTVRVEPIGNDEAARGRAMVLHANDSVAVGKVSGNDTADVVVQHNQTEPDRFVRPAQLAKLVSKQKHQHVARRQQYAEQIRRDPALVVYYDFQRRNEMPNVLHAVGLGADGAQNGLVQGEPPQDFDTLKNLGVNVLGDKPVEVSSSYNNDPTFAAPHLTDRFEASHAFSDGDSDQRLVIHGFNSPLTLVRLWRAGDRIAQQVTIRSSLSDQSSLNAADYSTTLATLSTLAFNAEGYVDIPVTASAGTQSLFFDFGDRTEYFPGGDWSHPAGIRTVEIQAFATPPAAPAASPAPLCWARGRTSPQTALQFDGINTGIKIDVPHRLTEMTLAAWLTLDFIDDKSVSSGLLTSSDWGEPGGSPESVRWHIGRTGEIFFGTAAHNVATPSVLPWQTWDRKRWRHLAVVADPAHQRTACYLDGKAIHVQPLSDSFAATVGAAGIGSWQRPNGRVEGGFFGRMDELFILSRAMTDVEIGELYEMERP